MSTRVDAVNRSVLAVMGLVLLVTGAAGLAAAFGALGDSGASLLPEAARDFSANQPWFWWAVSAACLLVSLLGLLWLLAQLRTDRAGRLDLTDDDRDGRTTVHASAVSDAVESEVESLRGVLGASAQVLDGRGRRLAVTVDLTEHADIAEVRGPWRTGSSCTRGRQSTTPTFRRCRLPAREGAVGPPQPPVSRSGRIRRMPPRCLRARARRRPPTGRSRSQAADDPSLALAGLTLPSAGRRGPRGLRAHPPLVYRRDGVPDDAELNERGVGARTCSSDRRRCDDTHYPEPSRS